MHDVHDVADAWAHRLLAESQRQARWVRVEIARSVLCTVALRRGDWQAAEQWSADLSADDVGTVAEMEDHPEVGLLLLRANTGQHVGLHATVTRAIEGVGAGNPMQPLNVGWAAGHAMVALGDDARAVEYFARALTAGREWGMADLRLASMHAACVEASIRTGDVEGADVLASEAESIAARSASGIADLEALRCRAAVLIGRGDPGRAAELLSATESTWSVLERPFEVACAYLLLAEARRQARARAAAHAALDAAEARFAALGARPWLARVADERVRIGARAGDPTRMTDDERSAAELARRGLTNAEIAAEQFVGVSAVEKRLRNVYRKLGVRTRAELLVLPDLPGSGC